MNKKQAGETFYSKDILGDWRNHNWSMRFDFTEFDFTEGYIGITQGGDESERILLTPRQFDELVKFVERQRGEGKSGTGK